jgi:hypothetical protein
MAAQVDPRAGPEELPPAVTEEDLNNADLPCAVAQQVGGRKPAGKRQKRDVGDVVYSSLSPDAPEHHDGTPPTSASARPTWEQTDEEIREKIQGSNAVFKTMRDEGPLCPQVCQVGDDLLASAEHEGPLAWCTGTAKSQVAVSFCGICNSAVAGRFSVHCNSKPHKDNLQMRAAGWADGKKAFTRMTTLTSSAFEEIPLDLTGSVDGTFDKHAQKNTQVSLFVYGAETVPIHEDLSGSEPAIADSKQDNEGRKLEGFLADNAFDASVKRDGDPDFCIVQNGGTCPNPGKCETCARLTHEQIANGVLDGYASRAENLSQAIMSRNKANGSAPIRICVAVSGALEKAPFATSEDLRIVEVQHGGKFALSRKSLDQVGIFKASDRSEDDGSVSLVNIWVPTGKETDPARLEEAWVDAREVVPIPQKLIGEVSGNRCGSMWSPTILSFCFVAGGREISVKAIFEPGFTYEIGDYGLISFWKMPMLCDRLLTPRKVPAIADEATTGGDEDEMVSGYEHLPEYAKDLIDLD